MPLMSLAATALDAPQHRSLVTETLLQYVATDPVVCRVEPGTLADKQAAALDPLLEWVAAETGAVLETTHSIFGAELREEALQRLRMYLDGERRSWEMEIEHVAFVFGGGA